MLLPVSSEASLEPREPRVREQAAQRQLTLLPVSWEDLVVVPQPLQQLLRK
jgi:hypothetical protein